MANVEYKDYYGDNWEKIEEDANEAYEIASKNSLLTTGRKLDGIHQAFKGITIPEWNDSAGNSFEETMTSFIGAVVNISNTLVTNGSRAEAAYVQLKEGIDTIKSKQSEYYNYYYNSKPNKSDYPENEIGYNSAVSAYERKCIGYDSNISLIDSELSSIIEFLNSVNTCVSENGEFKSVDYTFINSASYALVAELLGVDFSDIVIEDNNVIVTRYNEEGGYYTFKINVDYVSPAGLEMECKVANEIDRIILEMPEEVRISGTTIFQDQGNPDGTHGPEDPMCFSLDYNGTVEVSMNDRCRIDMPVVVSDDGFTVKSNPNNNRPQYSSLENAVHTAIYSRAAWETSCVYMPDGKQYSGDEHDYEEFMQEVEAGGGETIDELVTACQQFANNGYKTFKDE